MTPSPDRADPRLPLPQWFGRHSLITLALLLTVGTLLSSGRISSGDTGEQLQAAINLVQTGRLWSASPATQDHGLWVTAPSGVYYQCHDLASQLVLVPAGFFARSTDPFTADPPLPARVVAGYTYTLLGVLTVWLMYHTVRPVFGARWALALSLIFWLGTIFCAYTKSAWDVCGGTLGVAGLLCLLIRSCGPGGLTWQRALGIGAWTALACSFRYSLAPFLAIALIALAVRQRGVWPAKRILASAAMGAVLMLPQLAFNHARMGSFFKPATAAERFDVNNKLNGNTLLGTYGLIASPNKGLLWNTPAFALLFTLPRTWRRLPGSIRTLAGPMLLAAGLYLLMIGTMRNWGAFGWGARYAVPILPILFLPLAGLIVHCSAQRPGLIWTLVGLGVFSNSIALVTNYHLALAHAGPTAQGNPPYPAQQLATWKAAVAGLKGERLEAVAASDATARFGEFPDLLLVRIAEHSSAGKAGAWIVTIILLALLALLWRVALRPADADRPSVVPSQL